MAEARMNTGSVPEALRHGSVVLVCGAGISVNPPATLPDWKALRDETAAVGCLELNGK